MRQHLHRQMFPAAIPAQAAKVQAQAWPRPWPAGCEIHLHPWAEHKLVLRPSTCCSTSRSRCTAAAQQGNHQGLCAASNETAKAAFGTTCESCLLHRSLLLAQVSEAALCPGSCFWHRVHELLSAQVIVSGTVLAARTGWAVVDAA